MNRELWLLAALGLGFTGAAAAEVYRCEKDGKLQYSDRPCAKGDAPAALPPLSTVHRDVSDRALAKKHDRDAAAPHRARAAADAEWMASYSARKKAEKRVREGQIKNKVVVGMSEAQVHVILGEPTSERSNETASEKSEGWIFRDGKETQTVQFKDGKVTRVTRSGGAAGKSGHRR